MKLGVPNDGGVVKYAVTFFWISGFIFRRVFSARSSDESLFLWLKGLPLAFLSCFVCNVSRRLASS